MLVLTRKIDEKIMIGDNITITVIKLRNNQIRLGIEAPRDVRVLRGELEGRKTASPQIEEAQPAHGPEPVVAASQIRNEIVDGMMSADEMIAAGETPEDRDGGWNGDRAGNHDRDYVATEIVAGKIDCDGKFQIHDRRSPVRSTRAPLADFFTAP